VRTFPLFFEVLRVLITGGVTVVAEAAFQDSNWRQGLAPVLSLAQLRIIHCVVDDAVARERVARRRSERTRAAHADAEWLAASEARPQVFERIGLPAPALIVDTRDGYVPDLASVVAFVSAPPRRGAAPR
jgi:predicted kinase